MSMAAAQKLYNPLSDFIREKFGQKVFKVSLYAGLTCPNRDGTKGYGGCSYCDTATLLPKDFDPAMDIRAQLSTGMERVRERHRAEKFIAYFQINTNTHAPVDELERIYSQALHPDVAGIAVSTRPDCVNDGVLDLLSKIKGGRFLWLELGLQSANNRTLDRVNRGHTVEEFEDALKITKARGIDVCAHMIVGLPGEEREDIIKTAAFLAEKGVWGVKFHQLQVIRSTPLEEMHSRGVVKTLSIDEYASLVVECLEHLPTETVIHRLCGDVPSGFLVAPKWGANKFIITGRILEEMKKRDTFQGARYLRI